MFISLPSIRIMSGRNIVNRPYHRPYTVHSNWRVLDQYIVMGVYTIST